MRRRVLEHQHKQEHSCPKRCTRSFLGLERFKAGCTASHYGPLLRSSTKLASSPLGEPQHREMLSQPLAPPPSGASGCKGLLERLRGVVLTSLPLDTNLHVSRQCHDRPTSDVVGLCCVAARGRRRDRS